MVLTLGMPPVDIFYRLLTIYYIKTHNLSRQHKASLPVVVALNFQNLAFIELV